VENKMGLAIRTNAASLTSVTVALHTTQGPASGPLQVSASSQAGSARTAAIDFDFTAHIQGAKVAFRNALEAQGVVGTSEGAHEFLEKVLQQVRGVILQSPTTHNLSHMSVKGKAHHAPAIKDMVSSAKTQILAQSPAAVNVQANASRQNVLSLLQG
jgi:flagellin-like hook-associated protein FlgL